MKTKLTLPWPPSTNQYYRAIRRGNHAVNILSKQGREYKTLVRSLIGFRREKLSGCLAVTIKLLPPTRRAFDVDNRLKAILDALTDAGVWHDDSQVERITAYKAPKITGGAVEITIETMGETS